MNIERLKELFEPDYDKGILIWKIKSNSNVPAGSLAGNTGGDGKRVLDERFKTAEEAHEAALAARATYHDGYAREATT